MAFKQLLPLQNLNFQMNRVLTHGEKACREEELLEIAPKLREYDPKAWFDQWNMLAQRAEGEGRLMHAAYYHRMSEFFLPEGVSEKASAYEDFSRCFYAATKNENLEVFKVPYEGSSLPAIRLPAKDQKGVFVLHGGLKIHAQSHSLARVDYSDTARPLRAQKRTCFVPTVDGRY